MFMADNQDTIILILVVIFALLLIIPPMFYDNTSDMNGSENFTSTQNLLDLGIEDFGNEDFDNLDELDGIQLNNQNNNTNNNYESLIYDNTTGAIMSGSQFMENTGLITPRWIPPAWDPDAHGPSSKGHLDPNDYENDPRMLYNKCSLSCCSPQYPTPFQGTVDPFVCDEDGNNKYLSSNYVCQNNTGGTGCLCMTEKQADGIQTGFVDYYSDKDLGY